jgi:hypothetical protein
VSKLDSEKTHFKEKLEACKQGINEMAKGQVAILNEPLFGVVGAQGK